MRPPPRDARTLPTRDRLWKFSNSLKSREPIYEETADYIVDTEGKSPAVLRGNPCTMQIDA